MESLPISSRDLTRIRLVISPSLFRIPSTSSSTCFVAPFTGLITQSLIPIMISSIVRARISDATATIPGTLSALSSMPAWAISICVSVISSISSMQASILSLNIGRLEVADTYACVLFAALVSSRLSTVLLYFAYSLYADWKAFLLWSFSERHFENASICVSICSISARIFVFSSSMVTLLVVMTCVSTCPLI